MGSWTFSTASRAAVTPAATCRRPAGRRRRTPRGDPWRRAFIYLANALVDGTLALTALGAYGLVWATSETGAARDRELLKAVLDALVPRGGAFPIGAADTDLDETLARYFARLHPLGPAGLRVLLRAIEYGTVVLERPRPFSRLAPAARR